MTQRYEKTSHYWNAIYENQDLYNPKETRLSDDLESALNWVAQRGGTLMDFGSGDGKMLLRGLEKGAVKSIGIDLSFHGISLARRSAASCYENLRTKWIWGDVKSLYPLPDACASGLILSHILDHIHPEDGMTLLRMAHRLLDQNGRLLLILDPYIEPAQIEAQGSVPMTTEVGVVLDCAYTTAEGLYCWNLPDEKVLPLFAEDYQLIEQSLLTEEDGSTSRLYLLELKH